MVYPLSVKKVANLFTLDAQNNFFHNKILKISSQSVWQLHLHDNNSMNNLNSSYIMRSDVSCQKYDLSLFGSVKQRCRDLKTKGLFLLD